MKDWDWYWNGKLDQSIINYDVWTGKVNGGSDPGRTAKQVQNRTDSDGYYPGGDFTFELDLSNRSFVMWINNQKIIIDSKIGDFQYSPIVILSWNAPEITLLSQKTCI